jgi:hypothetical protein
MPFAMDLADRILIRAWASAACAETISNVGLVSIFALFFVLNEDVSPSSQLATMTPSRNC